MVLHHCEINRIICVQPMLESLSYSTTVFVVYLLWITTLLIILDYQRKFQILYHLILHAWTVLKHFKKLRANCNGGPDGLRACSCIFRVTSDSIIAVPLSIIFNLSLQSVTISDIWKVPVFKKGSPGDQYNYRPISLTCIGCKLIEAGIKDAIRVFLREHKIIN